MLHTSPPPSRVLVVDRHGQVVEALRMALGVADIHLVLAGPRTDGVALAREQSCEVALVALDAPGEGTTAAGALELIARLRQETSSMPVLAVGVGVPVETAIDAVRRGARDVIDAPWDDLRLIAQVRSHAELGRSLQRVAALESDNRRLRSAEAAPPEVANMRVRDMEALLVRQAMDRHAGIVSRAARSLGLSRGALYRRLNRHDIAHHRTGRPGRPKCT